MHPLLLRQIRKAELSIAEPQSAACTNLLRKVSQAYCDADLERNRLERAMQIASTEMAELNSRLASERDRLHVMIESMATALCVVRDDGTIEGCNGAFVRMLDGTREELVGHPVREILQGTQIFNDDGSLKQQAVERQLVTKTGRGIWVALSLSPLTDGTGFAILTAEDVTERKQLEVSLRHAQRLESVGQLAAGIAHEINTPIQFIGDNITFVRSAFEDVVRLRQVFRELVDNLPARDALLVRLEDLEHELDMPFLLAEVPKAIEQSLEGIAQVARIVQAMRVFSHVDQSDQATSVDLNAALQSTATVARNETKYVADVELDFGEIPTILGFPGDLNQVFLNLLVNAAHAVADVVTKTERRGTITLRTRSEGSSVLVAVSDTGTGIPEEVQRRIFDPFFTTKEVGRGTGQGLALARNIVVEKHKGEIWFETEVGKGTTFFVRLPVRVLSVLPPGSSFAPTRRKVAA